MAPCIDCRQDRWNNGCGSTLKKDSCSATEIADGKAIDKAYKDVTFHQVQK